MPDGTGRSAAGQNTGAGPPPGQDRMGPSSTPATTVAYSTSTPAPVQPAWEPPRRYPPTSPSDQRRRRDRQTIRGRRSRHIPRTLNPEMPASRAVTRCTCRAPARTRHTVAGQLARARRDLHEMQSPAWPAARSHGMLGGNEDTAWRVPSPSALNLLNLRTGGPTSRVARSTRASGSCSPRVPVFEVDPASLNGRGHSVSIQLRSAGRPRRA